MNLEFLDSLPLFYKGKALETPLLDKVGTVKETSQRAVATLWWEFLFTIATGVMWILFGWFSSGVNIITSYIGVLLSVHIFLWVLNQGYCKGNYLALFGYFYLLGCLYSAANIILILLGLLSWLSQIKWIIVLVLQIITALFRFCYCWLMIVAWTKSELEFDCGDSDPLKKCKG
eukprot:Mrub_10271.p1 GENE.Mrub_10271~~Mrub_10271.p1  ORF type:complete len:174 (+),score=11.54 Mrub_10271:1-522(+)